MLPTLDELLLHVPTFYKDYSSDEETLAFMLSLLLDVGEILEEYIEIAKDNMNISTIESYRKIPVKIIPATNSFYDIDKFLVDLEVTKYMGFTRENIEQRKAIWDLYPARSKIELLSKKGLFLHLSAKRPIDIVEPRIVAMNLFSYKGDRFIEDYDFFFDANRLFILSERALQQRDGVYVLRDIVLDFSVAERKFGSNMGLHYTESISRPAYRDFIQMASFAALGGPTVSNIKKAFESLAGWENVEIIDAYSPNNQRAELWNLQDDMLTPFDFIVRVPSEHSGNEEKLTIFDRFLNIIKPEDTHYIIAWAQNISDKLIAPLDNILHRARHSGDEDISATDLIASRMIQTEVYAMELVQISSHPNIFDDSTVEYDNNETIYDIATRLAVSENQYGDNLYLKHITFPEFPLAFTAVRNIITGHVTITYRDNEPNVTRYEVLRNGVVLTALNRTGTGLGNTITVTDTTLVNQPPGQYTYCARTVYEPNVQMPEQTKISQLSASVVITR